MIKNNYFIAIENPSKTNSKETLMIQGQFRVPYHQSGITVQGADMLKHIILVVTMGGARAVVRPFKDYVIFEDDIQDDGQSCSGYFKFNAFEKISFTEGDHYYIMCSIGTFTSDIVKVSV